MKLNFYARILLLAVMAVTLNACGDGSSSPTVSSLPAATPPVLLPTISVTILPASVQLPINASQQFNATVSGSSNTNVTWSLQEGAAAGTISSDGFYTAPSIAGIYHLIATSVADPTKSVNVTLSIIGAVASGPACSVGKIFGSGTTLPQLASAINNADAGDVVCINRGTVISATAGVILTGTAGISTAPITVCSSTGAACTQGGGANAQINVNTANDTSAVRIAAGVHWLVFRDIDFEGHGTGTALEFLYYAGAPPNHISFQGGLCHNWEACWLSNPWTNTEPPYAISLGTCSAPWFIRHTTGFAGGGYGYFRDSVLAMDMADTGSHGVFSHNIYFSTGLYAGSVSGVVVECSHFTDSGMDASGKSLGLHLKISGHVSGMIVRDNVFDDDNCGTYTIGAGSSNDDLAEDYAKLKVYRNTFRTSCVTDIECGSCSNSEIHDNLFVRRRAGSDGIGNFLQIVNDVPSGSRFGNNSVFNNTFIDEVNNTGVDALFRIGADQLDNNLFYNNVIYTTNPSPYVPFLNGDCTRFGGSGGPGFHNNFIYTTNASFISPCSAGIGNSSVFNVAPGFINMDAGYFDITTSSPLYGAGRSTDATTSDFNNALRPSPPSIGAFDVAP